MQTRGKLPKVDRVSAYVTNIFGQGRGVVDHVKIFLSHLQGAAK